MDEPPHSEFLSRYHGNANLKEPDTLQCLTVMRSSITLTNTHTSAFTAIPPTQKKVCFTCSEALEAKK